MRRNICALFTVKVRGMKWSRICLLFNNRCHVVNFDWPARLLKQYWCAAPWSSLLLLITDLLISFVEIKRQSHRLSARPSHMSTSICQPFSRDEAIIHNVSRSLRRSVRLKSLWFFSRFSAYWEWLMSCIWPCFFLRGSSQGQNSRSICRVTSLTPSQLTWLSSTVGIITPWPLPELISWLSFIKSEWYLREKIEN